MVILFKFKDSSYNKTINFKEQFIIAIKSRVELLMAFITAKEEANFKLIK